MRLRMIPLAALAIVAAAVPAYGATIHVDAGGGGDYETIQDGVSSSSNGDTVLVAAGTYTGESNRDIKFGGRNIIVMSESGRDVTIIDCQNLGRGFKNLNGEDSSSAIIGFTIMNATASSHGGGVYLFDASTTIRDCVFSGCEASWGGGICVFRYAGVVEPLISDCVFYDNTATDGAGIASYDGTPTITGCTFFGNSATLWNSAAITCNGDYTTPTITNCTIADNTGGGIYCYYSSPTITNTIIAFSDDAPGFGQAIVCGTSADPEITHCIIYENAGGDSLCGTHHDNLFVDPRFCGMPADDYTLCANSHGLPVINGWGVTVGAHGEGCADCDSPVENASWGAFKNLYR